MYQIFALALTVLYVVPARVQMRIPLQNPLQQGFRIEQVHEDLDLRGFRTPS
jgi:hypothetical protein